MKDHANHRSYVGVRKRKWGKWVSEIREPGKKSRIWLGSYEEAEMAAAAYDVAALHLKGPTARFNFPDLVNTFWKPASDRPEDVQLAAQEAAQAMRRNNIQAMRRNNNLHFDDQRVGLSPTEIQAINESPLDSPTTNYAVMMMMDMVHADQDQAAAAGGEQEEQPLYDYNQAAREWDDDAVAYYSIWD